MHATSLIPPHVPNWIDGREQDAKEGQALPNLNPATGRELCTVARSTRADVEDAVGSKESGERFARVVAVESASVLLLEPVDSVDLLEEEDALLQSLCHC